MTTAAASGVGFGLCERFAAEGMKVMMADAEAPSSPKRSPAVPAGRQVRAVVSDESKANQVERLGDEAVEAFSAVADHAGTGGAGRGG